MPGVSPPPNPHSGCSDVSLRLLALIDPWMYNLTFEGETTSQVGGYATRYATNTNFTFITVRGGRHEVPETAPDKAYAMLAGVTTESIPYRSLDFRSSPDGLLCGLRSSKAASSRGFSVPTLRCGGEVVSQCNQVATQSDHCIRRGSCSTPRFFI